MVPFALVLSTIAQASCITCSAEQNTERAVKLAEGDDLQFTVQVVQLDDVDANRYSEVFVSFRLLHSGEVFRTGTHKGTGPWPVARFGCCGERSPFCTRRCVFCRVHRTAARHQLPAAGIRRRVAGPARILALLTHGV